MRQNKKSWDYQKGKYKQINIKLNLDNEFDAAIDHYLTCNTKNVSRLIKDLLFQKLEEDLYNETI